MASGGGGGGTSYMKLMVYTNMPQEWLNFISFQIFDRFVNFPLQYINGSRIYKPVQHQFLYCQEKFFHDYVML
jgi:hypothetical protein